MNTEINEEKGRAMPNWIVEHFNNRDIIFAIQRKLCPNWRGAGSGETLDIWPLKKDKESYSRRDLLKRTPKGILAVMAWDLEVRKADFIDAYHNTWDDSFRIKRVSKLTEIMLYGACGHKLIKMNEEE